MLFICLEKKLYISLTCLKLKNLQLTIKLKRGVTSLEEDK